jgi:hypothetical protein
MVSRAGFFSRESFCAFLGAFVRDPAPAPFFVFPDVATTV